MATTCTALHHASRNQCWRSVDCRALPAVARPSFLRPIILPDFIFQIITLSFLFFCLQSFLSLPSHLCPPICHSFIVHCNRADLGLSRSSSPLFPTVALATLWLIPSHYVVAIALHRSTSPSRSFYLLVHSPFALTRLAAARTCPFF